jgi:betaine-homocysteine S-methyltransferase
VAVECPEALLQLHTEFRRAGAQVLQALTFYGSEEKLAVGGHGAEAARINRAAVRLARQAAGPAALVAGVVTLSPSFRPGDRGSLRQVRRGLEQQRDWLCTEGVDLLIGETFVFLEEAALAVSVLRTAGLPVMVTMNIGAGGSRDGLSPAACARRLCAEGADVVGVNCSFDPEDALPTAAAMARAVDIPVACQPVGYRTSDLGRPFTELDGFPLALESRQLTRFDLASFARRALDLGIRYIGGCCGVAPYHIRAMAEALGRRPEAAVKSPDMERHVIAAVRDRWADRGEAVP